MKLAGQVAIVTGSASGPGHSPALCPRRGPGVVGDINGDGAEETARLITRQEGGRAVAVKADVSQADEVRNLVDTALSHYGRLDMLINNAGATLWKGIEDTSEEEWDRILNINLKGVFLGCKFAIPAMRQVGAVAL